MSGARRRRRISTGRGIDCIRPRDSGGRGTARARAKRAEGGGGGAGAEAALSHSRTLLFLVPRTFGNDNEALSPAPPPPRFARCASSSGPPPPLSRGRKEKGSRSRDAPAPEVCRPKLRIVIASKKRREAERRKAQFTGAASADAARALRSARSPSGAPPRFSPRPFAEARSRPRFTRSSAQTLPAP